MIETPDVLRMDTTAGAVNCVPSPHGIAGYSELIVNATEVSLGGDVIVHVASLDGLLRIARAENGPFRMADIEMLSVLKKQREREKL